MLLRPRKFVYKNIFKRRSLPKIKNNNLIVGMYGLKLLQPMRLNSKHIFRIKLFLKKSSRKFDLTMRFVWFNLFPHLPLSKKIKGARMGKGTGKLATWFTELPSGIVLFEFKNMRSGRALFFSTQIQYKLPVKTRILSLNIKKASLPLKKSKHISSMLFW